MSIAKRLARILSIATAAVIAFALVFPLAYAVVVPLPDRPDVTLPAPPAGTYTIYVADWDYHTSIVLPQPASWALGPPGRERAPFVEFAWGDRQFYRDSDYRPHSVFATLFLPTASVAYVAGSDRAPLEGNGAQAVYARQVDEATLLALATELERTIRRDANGSRVPPSPPVPGFSGRFHDAYGAYLWTVNCNSWTVDRLAAVELATSPRLVVFSGQVAGRLRGFDEVARAP